MYILVDGKVELTKLSVKGGTLVRIVSTPNDFFGEMALIDGKPRSATATAVEETKLLVVGREAFESLLDTKPLFGKKIVKALSERIRSTNTNLTELSDMPPRERIARALADFAQRFGAPAGEQARYVELAALKKWLNGHAGVLFEEVDAVVTEGIAKQDFACARLRRELEEAIIVPERYISAWDRRAF